MARIAAFLASFFGSVFTWFSGWLSSKVAMVAAIVTVSLASLVALFAAMKVLVVGLVSTVPYEPFVMGFYACWPSNAETCISACWAADIAVFLYKYKMRVLALVSK